jgi:purine-nucleoside phosphorylase
MKPDDAIVRPVCNARSPRLGGPALLAASQLDFRLLAERLQLPDRRHLYMSQLLFDARHKDRPVLVGPLMGAPYAAMLLEILHAWGVDQIYFMGWCGSIDPDVRIGDILLPTSALVDEGTSLHYRCRHNDLVYPDQTRYNALASGCRDRHVTCRDARVWTTDGVFRETPEKVAAYQARDAQAVEMELSAIFSVAAFRRMAAAGILVVSDELFSLSWKPGFKESKFLASREQVIDGLCAAVRPRRNRTG